MQVIIKFDVPNVEEIGKVLDQVKEQIAEGSICNTPHNIKYNGYIPNKWNDIKIKDESGFAIGKFKVTEEDKESD